MGYFIKNQNLTLACIILQKQKVFSLNHILSNHFLKYSIVPIFIIEVSLLILYFTINSYIYDKNVISYNFV